MCVNINLGISSAGLPGVSGMASQVRGVLKHPEHHARHATAELYVYNLMVQGQQTLLFYTAYSYGFNIELFLMWEEAKPKCLIYIVIAGSTRATPF